MHQAINLLWQSRPAVFDGLLGVSPGKNDDRVELGVVQLVDGRWGYVKKSVLSRVHNFSDRRETNNARLGLAVASIRHVLL